jgi:transposase
MILSVENRTTRSEIQSYEKLDGDERMPLQHLGQTAPGLAWAAALAKSLTTMVRDHHDTDFENWLNAAHDTELSPFATVCAALTDLWNTSPVEGHINRVKIVKRQMYGRAKYDLLRQRVLAAA